MIIGITGTFASGKDTVADFLKKKKFVYFSLSDIIREECYKINQETTRENLINMGNKLRIKYGESYLAQQVLKKINEKNIKKALAVSIRHPKEVKEFRKDPNFFLITVNGPQKIRFLRTQKRKNRPEDKDSFREFKEHEERERKGKGHKQQLDKIAKMADFRIINKSTLRDLYKKIEKIIIKINEKTK